MELTLDRLERVANSFSFRLKQGTKTISRDTLPVSTTQFSNSLWQSQSSAINRFYEDSSIFESFKNERIWIAPYFIANLISNGSLSSKELRILDIGCHHSNILTAMKKLSENGKNFNVQNYTGLDLSPSAIHEAKTRFPEHQYLIGDALNTSSYKEIPDKSKNLIVCSGVCDYLPPSKIKTLIANISKKLANDDEARSYLTYRTICPRYGLDKPVMRKLPLTTKILLEEGIQFYGFPDPNDKDLTLFNYHPDDFKQLIEEQGFEIEIENSRSCPSVERILGSDYDYLCLRKKQHRILFTINSCQQHCNISR